MMNTPATDISKNKDQAGQHRSRHINPDGSPRYTNRLALETSPYLLQHAHNPVDWWPWSEEAFREAERLSLPLIVSIGYSTCHWCHVMEEESFEDEEIATFMNDHFICVKVDREERPDVDAIYMGAVQLLTGQGGWPLNVIMSPDMNPFFGGTYFPARDGDRGAATGFLTLLKKIAEAWNQKQDVIARSGEEISRHIRKMLTPEPGTTVPGNDLFDHAARFFKSVYDPVYGGIKGSPKFPASFHTRFLFRAASFTGDNELERMALFTLDAMANGGMYDHAGGGFHRYSTDQMWLVPHFEKMLYDNALLVPSYLEAFKITGKDRYETVAREILDYVLRDMTSPEGGFYSATDADSLTPSGKKEEGYHFTWSRDELARALPSDQLARTLAYFSMEGPPHFEGRYIPHITSQGRKKAQDLGLTPEGLRKIKQTLYRARDQRKRPATDTKILASWNGLMITAFARAGLTLAEETYTKTAEGAARFIVEHLMSQGRLFRTFTSGQAKYNAYLDDYAFITAGFLDLYEAAGDTVWLDKAMGLDRVLEAFYEDKDHGGFFMTSTDHENLIAREKPYHDSALPSGNAIAVMNLLRLYGLTQDARFLSRAEKALHAFSQAMAQSPGACGELLVALDFYIHPPREIVIVYPEGQKDKTGPFLEVLRHARPFNHVLSIIPETMAEAIPITKGKKAGDNKPLAYVCRQGHCDLPAASPDEFKTKVNP